MPNRRAAAIRDLSDEALVARLSEEKATHLKLRFRLATGELENHAELTRVKREIARVQTEIRSREIAAAEGVAR